MSPESGKKDSDKPSPKKSKNKSLGDTIDKNPLPTCHASPVEPDSLTAVPVEASPTPEVTANTEEPVNPELERLEKLHAANQLRGFDKLEDIGFARTDIDSARAKFYSSHPEKRSLSPLEKLAAEEAFIESDHALISSSVCHCLALIDCIVPLLIFRRNRNCCDIP